MPLIQNPRYYKVANIWNSGFTIMAAIFLIVQAAGSQTLRPKGLPQSAHAEVDGLALTPPMGWYPWNIDRKSVV
jgi:hypothetical protein